MFTSDASSVRCDASQDPRTVSSVDWVQPGQMSDRQTILPRSANHENLIEYTITLLDFIKFYPTDMDSGCTNAELTADIIDD